MLNQYNIMQLGLVLLILLPIVGFILTIQLKNRDEKKVASIFNISIIIYLLLSCFLFISWFFHSANQLYIPVFELYSKNDFQFILAFHYDYISAIFGLVSSIILFAVGVFGKFYMHRESGYKRYFATLHLFIFGIHLIYYAGNFETLFIGWEFIGLCSFLLIAFYRNRYLPVKNAFKILSFYRLADVSLILAMWILHHLFHKNFQFSAIENITLDIRGSNENLFLAAIFSVIVAVLLKSAQFPFFTWLPRAMEGPTVSSAVFYGAIGSHIGIFLLLKTYPLWVEQYTVKVTLVVVGLLTTVIANQIARVQSTVKTQIAYAISSQIGLIIIEIALGLHILALIHIIGHVFLRTYQLLVSPSQLNYLIHSQYFQQNPRRKYFSNISTSVYVLNIREWNLDALLRKYMWTPFKIIGNFFTFLSGRIANLIILILLMTIYVISVFNRFESPIPISYFLAILSFLLTIQAFAHRGNAIHVMRTLLFSHAAFFLSIYTLQDTILQIEMLYYFSGILISFVVAMLCLIYLQKHKVNLELNRYNGLVEQYPTVSMVLFLAVIGIIGFPITTAFIGIDVLITYIPVQHLPLMLILLGVLYFLEIATIRIFLRTAFGIGSTSNRPKAFRST